MLSAFCWCESTEVLIPVQWVSEAKTGSCGPDCGPGCPTRASGFTEDSFTDPDSEVARTGKKTKMKRFDASKYDPRVDSSYGYARSETRDLHPHDLILEVHGDLDQPRLCACGCAESPKGKNAIFGMGHDARLRGKLARALAGGAQVVLTDANHVTQGIVSPAEYAERFSTDKLDWAASITESASKAKRSAGVEAEILERAVGPQVGDTKLIKIGRWEKTGRIVAIYQDGSEVLYEYADQNGKLRQARQSADGKIREVKPEAAAS